MHARPLKDELLAQVREILTQRLAHASLAIPATSFSSTIP